MMSTFSSRSERGEKGFKVVERILGTRGGKIFRRGVEENHLLSQELRSRHDIVALMERYKEDCIVTLPCGITAINEIKSVDDTYRNISIEAVALWVMKEKARHLPEGVHWTTIANTNDDTAQAIMTGNLPNPPQIYFPDRSDRPILKRMISKWFPEAKLIDKDRQKGSGTPYILMPKNFTGLKEFGRFLDDEISNFKKDI